MDSAPGVPVARSPREMLVSRVLLSDFLLSAPGGGVPVRGGVATGGVFKAFPLLIIDAWEMAEPYTSSLAPIMTVAGRTKGEFSWGALCFLQCDSKLRNRWFRR